MSLLGVNAGSKSSKDCNQEQVESWWESLYTYGVVCGSFVQFRGHSMNSSRGELLCGT